MNKNASSNHGLVGGLLFHISRFIGQLVIALALLTVVFAASGQGTISSNNFCANGSFDLLNNNGWSWWAGGEDVYLATNSTYNDETNTIFSFGWWDGANIYQNTGYAIQPNTDYVLTARVRDSGSTAIGGVFLELQDASLSPWSVLSSNRWTWANSANKPGPWFIYSSRVSASTLVANVGDQLAVAVGIVTNGVDQYGWMDVDWVQLAPANPVFTVQPQSETNFTGGAIVLSSAALGAVSNSVGSGSVLQYQWYLSPSTAIAGATNSTLTFANLALTNAGTYYVTASGPFGASQSSNAVITVLPANGAVIVTGPQSAVAYPHQTVQFGVSAAGTQPLYYQWQSNSVPIPGATGTNLVLANVSSASAATYSVVVTNSSGSASSNATLTVVSVVPGSYEAGVINTKPLVYLRFSTLNSTSFVTNEGTLGPVAAATAEGSYVSDNGPQPPAFPNFESANLCMQFDGYDTDAAIPPLNLPATNTYTFACWLETAGVQSDYSGIVFERGGINGGGGLSLQSSGNINYLAYDWAGNQWDTSINTNFTIPDQQWCFAALVISPTNSTLYFGNPIAGSSVASASYYATNNPICDLGGVTEVGWDSVVGSLSRRFIGDIDEVVIYNQALSATQVNSLYQLATAPATPPTLAISALGGNVVLTWSNGTLLSSPTVNGAYSAVIGATSPYTIPSNVGSQFFRVSNP